VDGIEAMEGNGPIEGTSKRLGVVVAGTHLPSVDATCCRIMRLDPLKLKYLQFSATRSAVDIWHADQTCEAIESVESEFALHPDLVHLRLS
jgi:uncharacterized protein (DUF362 family)